MLIAKRSLLLMGTVVLGAAVLRAERPQDPPPRLGPDGKPETWMVSKLHDSQDVFAGLTRGDFDAVNLNARRMRMANLLEQWSRQNEFTRRADYEKQVNAFDFAVKELIRASAQRDSDETLEAYQQLSASCVRCHQAIRDVTKTKGG